MDINKIFTLFSPSDDQNEIKSYDESIIWVRMFKKLIYNHKVLNKQLSLLFKNNDEKIDMETLKDISIGIVYSRAYENISNIDLSNPIHIETLITNGDDIFEKSLILSIKYFECKEEYEKCGFLQKIQNLITSSQK